MLLLDALPPIFPSLLFREISGTGTSTYPHCIYICLTASLTVHDRRLYSFLHLAIFVQPLFDLSGIPLPFRIIGCATARTTNSQSN